MNPCPWSIGQPFPLMYQGDEREIRGTGSVADSLEWEQLQATLASCYRPLRGRTCWSGNFLMILRWSLIPWAMIGSPLPLNRE